MGKIGFLRKKELKDERMRGFLSSKGVENFASA